MHFNGPTRTATLIIIGLLTLNLCICGFLSFQGSGAKDVGPRQVRSSTIRSGSIGGPGIFGGGSGSGK